LGQGVTVCLTTTTIATLAMLFVSSPCTRLSATVPAWQNLQERDPEACVAMFLVRMVEEDVI